MLRPLIPVSVMMSVKTRGDSVMTPLAVRCGSVIGTRTARTLNSRIVGEESIEIASSSVITTNVQVPTSAFGDAIEKRILPDFGNYYSIPLTKYMSISPLPLAFTLPRYSHSKSF